MAANFHIPQETSRRGVAIELQDMLVDLIDLTLIGKHAHWNVAGPHFRSVHRELDHLVDSWRELADDVAERAATIGAWPGGQAETVAGATDFELLPAGRLADDDVLEAISERLSQASARTRARIDRVASDDPVTCDLLLRVAGTLEKQLWMVRAQTVTGRAAKAESGADGLNGNSP